MVVASNEQRALHASPEVVRRTLAGMAGSRDAVGPTSIHSGGRLRSSQPFGGRDVALLMLRRLEHFEPTIRVPTRPQLFLLLFAPERPTQLGPIRADDTAPTGEWIPSGRGLHRRESAGYLRAVGRVFLRLFHPLARAALHFSLQAATLILSRHSARRACCSRRFCPGLTPAWLDA